MGTAAWGIAILGMAVVPLAIGIAILRYRLYEIDRLISRSIGWGLLTVILGAVFVGLVLGLQTLLAPFTGSTLTVAGSTLLGFSLFQPVDDGSRPSWTGASTAHATTPRRPSRLLRAAADEVDLEILQGGLLTIVEATLEPTTASLWLRE